MPIYEYEGKRYDVATDDVNAAKEKILSYLGKSAAPATEPPPAATETVEPPKGIAGAVPPEVEGMTPEATKRRTGIADVLYNTIMSPIGLLGGVDVNAPEVKQDSPFFSALGKSVTRFKQSGTLNELAELENLRNIVEKQGALSLSKGTKEEQLERINKSIKDKQRDLAEYGMETKAIEETFGKNKFTQKYDALTDSPAYKEAPLPKQMAMTGELFIKDPIGVASYARDIGAENFLSAVPTIAAAIAARFAGFGTTGAAATGGYSSAMNEFGNQYAELRAQGKSHEDAWTEAGIKSSVIGLFDAASFKSAGKAMDTIVSNSLKKAPLKETAKEVGKETAKQAGLGGAGEALGSVAINQPVDLRNVLEEALGETVGAPAEAVTTYSQKKGVTPPQVGVQATEPKFEIDPQTGVLRPVAETTTESKQAAPLTKQGELFTKEEAPYQVTPGEISVEAQARQEASDRAADQIVVLKQQLAQTTDPQQAAAIRDDISKLELLTEETGKQKAIRLGDEMVTLYRKGNALTQQKTELETARDAEKSLDGKQAITEQIKAIDAQLEQVIARQEEISAEGKKLEKEGVTFDKTKDELDLKGPSPIVGNAMSKFGIPPKALVRQRIKNLDMTDPEDRAKFEQEIFEFDANYPGKLKLDAIENYMAAFTTPTQEAPVEPSIRETRTGASVPSVSVPSGQPQPTTGVTTPTTTGLAGAEPTAGGPVAGAGVVDQTGQGTLTETPKIAGELKGKATIQLADRITQGDLKGALEEIATSDQYTLLDKLVAKRLLQAKTLPKVEIVSLEVTGGDPAQYDPNTDTVQITPGNIDSHTVLHETVHGFLHAMIRQSEAREAKGLGGNTRLNSLKDVYNHVKKTRPDLLKKYGMKDLSEFASEAMSNPDFQNDLRNTPYRRSNVFTEFARAVLRAMGINVDKSGIVDIDALAGALIAAEGALSTGRKVQEDVQGGVRQQVDLDIAKQDEGAFKNWFGDSKVVNPDGSPMVVYHGTTKNINQFKMSKEGSLGAGIYMTPSTSFANNYAGMPTPSELADIEAGGFMTPQQIAQLKAIQETGELVEGQMGGNVMPVYASIENPLIINTVDRRTDPAVDLLVALGVTQEKAESIVEKAYEDKGGITKEVMSRAQKQGYDGIMQYKDGVLSEVVAFSPYQVKSAIGNTGEYSRTTADIAKVQRTPEAEKAEKDSAAFAASAGPVPKAGFFKRTFNKLQAVRNGNLNAGSAVFGNLQNFAANNQAFLNLMRKETLELEKKGSITHAQAEATMLGLIGAQITQRAQLAVQMMDNGNWKYDPITNTYDPIPDKDNMAVFGDLANALAKRLGVSPEVALSYIDQALEANRLQSVDDKLIKAKSELTRAEKRIEFLENDVKRQRIPAGTRTAADQRAFDRTENARIETVRKELELKKKLVEELKDNIKLYTDQMMHKDRANIKAGMELYNDHPEIQEATRVWNVMRERTIDLMVETGLLTREKAETWLDEAAYVPFFRDVESATEEAQQIMTKGLRETMAPLRAKFKGSMEEVTSVTSNMRQWMQWAMAGSISNRQIKRMLDQYRAYLPDEVREGRDPSKGNFTVMEEGVERVYNVDNPDIAQAFIQQGAYIFPLMGIAKGASDIARKNITRNPLFSVGQIPADLYAAMFTSGIRNPGALVVRLLSEAVKTSVGMSQTRKDLIRRGLLSTHEYNAQLTEDSIKYAQDVIPPSAYRRVMHLLDRFGAVSENIIRQAVYNQLRSEGASQQKAETTAVEIMNFRNKSGIKALNSLSSSVIFFNSWLQSLALILKTLSGKGVTYQTRADGLKTLGIVSAKVAVFSFLLAALSDMADEEDEYAKRNRAGKNRIFGIPGTDGMGLAVREDVYVLPHILAQYAYRNMFREIENRGVDMKSFKGSLKNIAINSLVPPSEGVPQLIKPTVEGALGVNIHTGQAIVPEHMRALEPELQFTATTAEYAKAMGAATGTSPLMIEHFVKGYFGTTAQLFDMLFGGLIAQARDIPRPARSTREVLGKLPSVGVSFGKTENMAVAEDLYEAKKEFDRALKTYKKLNETNNKAAQEYRAENAELMHNPAGTVKELENIKRRENYIRNLPSREKNPEKGMSAEEKAAELEVLKARKERLAPLVQRLRRKADF